MAEWPTVSAVKLELGVTSDAKDGVIADSVGAAIEQVALDIGYSDVLVTESNSVAGSFELSGDLDTSDESGPIEILPNYSLARAAMILAVMSVKAPDAPYGIAAVFDIGAVRVAAQHPTYLRMLVGSRRSFGLV